MLKNKKGQNTLEYLILFSGVVIVFTLYMLPRRGGFQTRMEQSLDDVTESMTTVSCQTKRLVDPTADCTP